MPSDPAICAGGVDHVFASQWWPQSENGIAWRWAGSGGYEDLSAARELSPAEKYDLLFGKLSASCSAAKHPLVKVVGPATQWELERHGLYQRVSPDNWWGHCNGWSSYATAEALG